MSSQRCTGFTLVELLIVIAIIAVLAGVVIIAVNPSRQLADARNAQRFSDINSILNAFWQYAIDNNGRWQPASADGAELHPDCSITAAAKKLCKETVPHGTADGACGDPADGGAYQCIYTRHLSGTYINSVAMDPGDNEITDAERRRVDYAISTATISTRLRVSAPNAELEEILEVTR